MTLIIPASAPCDLFPYIFETDSENDILLYKSISGIDPTLFNHIYISILEQHAIKYDIENKIKESFIRHSLWDKTEIVKLKNSSCEPETIAQTIEKCEIKGSFMIKDADNYFQAQIQKGNYVCVYPLDQLTHVNPANKSYVELDYSMYITNIIEKRIIGRNFCTGGYCFNSTEGFLEKYSKLSKIRKGEESFFLSHIIFAMLMEGQTFRPIIVENYKDWGTKEEWIEHRNRSNRNFNQFQF